MKVTSYKIQGQDVPKYKYTILDIVSQLHGCATGTGDCISSELGMFYVAWLQERLNGWQSSPRKDKKHVSYEEALKKLISVTIDEYCHTLQDKCGQMKKNENLEETPVKEKEVEKKSVKAVAGIVEYEGLGYAVQYALDSSEIAHKELAKLWVIAKSALMDVEKFLFKELKISCWEDLYTDESEEIKEQNEIEEQNEIDEPFRKKGKVLPVIDDED